MHRWSQETQEWLDLASKRLKPHALHYNSGTLILSHVRDRDLRIVDQLNEYGRVWWRVVEQSRARTITMTASNKHGRFSWDASERTVAGEKMRVTFEIPQPHPEGPLEEFDHACRFAVTSAGPEIVESSCTSLKARFRSHFVILPDEGNCEVKRDWLLALAKGVEGLPGGKIFLGPLIKLREDEKAAARNAEIDGLFVENRAFSEEALRIALRLDGKADLQTEAMFSLLRWVAPAVIASETGRVIEPLVSRFPLPISKGVILSELEAVGFEVDDAREIAARTEV